MSDVILYTTDDGRNQVKLRAKDATVWVSQREMAQLFNVSTDNVGLHLKNIFEDGELSKEATTEESSVVQIEGRREGPQKAGSHSSRPTGRSRAEGHREQDQGALKEMTDCSLAEREKNVPALKTFEERPLEPSKV